MQQNLQQHLPQHAVVSCLQLIKTHHINIKIVKERKTRHGDYKRLPNGNHQITINKNLNPYRFLLTLIHEIAHLVAFKKHGYRIKPHGTQWKETFRELMLPFLHPEVFPLETLPFLAHYFKNPKASTDADVKLALALKQFDAPNNKNYIFELPLGSNFKLTNGKVFKRGNQRVKRFECTEMETGRTYLFSPHAEVELLKETV